MAYPFPHLLLYLGEHQAAMIGLLAGFTIAVTASRFKFGAERLGQNGIRRMAGAKTRAIGFFLNARKSVEILPKWLKPCFGPCKSSESGLIRLARDF